MENTVRHDEFPSGNQYVTKDYSRFVINNINRLHSDGGVIQPRKDLVASMKKYGYQEWHPIICVKVNGRLRILDGNNRFVTARSLNLPVHYLVYSSQEALAATPSEFNKNMKSWTFNDYFTAAAQQGNEDILEILEYCKVTGIQPYSACAMFAGHTTCAGVINERVKNNTYRIRNRTIPSKVAFLVDKLSSVFKYTHSRHLINALSKCVLVKSLDIAVLAQKIERYPERLEKRKDTDGYIRMLEEIYNWRTHGKKLRLSIEIEEDTYRRKIGSLVK